MIRSIHDPAISDLFRRLRRPSMREAVVDGKSVQFQSPFPSPADWRDLWIYQLMVDRFNNPAAPPKALWNGRNRYIFQGGTLNGVREKLSYLQGMGVGAIWLSPVQKNCMYRNTYHGYAVQDFLAIDPRLASDPDEAIRNPQLVEDELHALIDEAHARGIYIVFDIVLHHVGDVFAYCMPDGSTPNKAPFNDDPYEVQWRDSSGTPHREWPDIIDVPESDVDAGVWPLELRSNSHFYRRGEGFEIETDFKSLKAIVTDGTTDAREVLIRAYQYLVGKFDVDGLRVDAFKHIDKGYGRVFCSSMREYAESIGKMNFFIFCEVFDSEDMIVQYIGRNTLDGNDDDTKAADAALDFPLMFVLGDVAKGIKPPSDLAHIFEYRKEVGKTILSTHGEASKFFVTFLDNHDQFHRIRFEDSSDPTRYDDQVLIALGSLFGLQGIPCLYYGTEQGLNGWGDSEEAVREALWGAPNPFDTTRVFYQWIKSLTALRNAQPALRYGRLYTRPISVDALRFEISRWAGDPYAFSRVLSEQEILVVANPNLERAWKGQVIVDIVLNAHEEPFDVLLTNKPGGPTESTAATYPDGRARYLEVSLQPGEIQFLSNRK